ncbi:MAG: nickel/cobalt transporter, partial [Candidatus Limnocylindria bacterium]
DLTFPPGVGGLETLRLECTASAALARSREGTRRTLDVADLRDDGRPGWREVTIAALPGVALVESDVPAVSPSGRLTAYPEDLLAAPVDVRAGSAVFMSAGSSGAAPAEASTAIRQPPSDPLTALLTAPAGRSGGVGVLLAMLVSTALGAAHALSPGHGKALVAAALVGSRGTPRQAVGLGLTVAASHTVGVLALGAVVLGAGTALAPDRLLAWLSLVAGGCVVAVGVALLLRAAFGARHRDHDHAHPHPHPHPHAGPHRSLATRAVIGLGLFGGLVPSSSAIIVLLLAVTTGQLALGLGLILAFGLGMAGVLGAFALVSTWLGDRLLEARVVVRRPMLARIGAAIPLLSAVTVVVAGTLMTVGALAQVL